MDAVKKLIFGDGGEARRAQESARAQGQLAVMRQDNAAQAEQARVDLQAGKTLKTPRGRRLLLDGPAGGSDLAETVG